MGAEDTHPAHLRRPSCRACRVAQTAQALPNGHVLPVQVWAPETRGAISPPGVSDSGQSISEPLRPGGSELQDGEPGARGQVSDTWRKPIGMRESGRTVGESPSSARGRV